MKAWKVLLVVGMGAVVAGAALGRDDGGRSRTHGNAQVIIVGEDGEPHQRSWVFDDDGSGGYLGVSLTDARAEDGARIVTVVGDSPADDAGLREDDVILAVNGEEVRGPRDVTRLVRGAEPGDEIDLEVRRGDRERTVTVELGERPNGFSFFFGGDGDDEGSFPHGFSLNLDDLHGQLDELREHLDDMDLPFGSFAGGPGVFHFRTDRPRLGVELVQPTPELRKYLGGPDDAGVIVGKVLPETPAEDAGVAVGDLIVAVDDDPVRNTGDLLRALSRGGDLTLEVVRDGRTRKLDVTLPQDEEEETPGPTRLMRRPVAPVGTSLKS